MSMRPPDAEVVPERALGRPLTVRECVPAAFVTWARNARAFAVVSVVYQLPVSLLFRLAPKPKSDLGPMALGIASVLLQFLAWNLTLGAVTFGVLETRSGRRATIGRCLGVSFRTVGALFGISFRMAVQLMLWAVLGGFVGFLAASLLQIGRRSHGDFPVTSLVAMFGVMGVAVLAYFARYATSGPVAVVERLDHWYSMDRSRRLSEGRRFAIAMTLLLVSAPTMALSIGAGLMGGISGGAPDVGIWPWIGVAIDVLFGGPMAGAAVATVYHALRRERDGVGAEDLARVFE